MKKIILFYLVFMGLVQAKDGSLDSTFGDGGVVITSVTSGNDRAYGAVLQPDGKIVAVGYSTLGSNFILARYNTDGSLDSSFGSGGIVVTSIGGTDIAYAALLQPDGKIVAVGYSGGDFALARYHADGTLDSSFGSGGIVITAINGGTNVAHATLLQSDGKIVAIGYSSVGFNFVLVRYNIDGTLDSSFGSGGIVITSLGGTDIAYDAALQSDGKIVVAGRTDNDFGLVRYNVDGSLDTSFGSGGIVTTSLSAQDEAEAVLLRPDGKIVAAGFTTHAGNAAFALVQYKTNGSLDYSFGSNGTVITPIGTDDAIEDITLQPDGKIIAGGYALIGGDYIGALTRYNMDGALDSSFGTDGIITKYLGGITNSDNDWLMLLMQPDGKIDVVGYTSPDGSYQFALLRLLIPSLKISSLARNLRAKYALIEELY